MIHNIRVIKQEQLVTNKWAGGTTTQLAIYPENAVYADRDFLWRLSTAAVEAEKSDFTKLPGYDRILMVLEGELRLQHKGRHQALLKQYEQDYFKGSWDTVSYGMARDFNLMMREGLEGRIRHYSIARDGKLSVQLKEEKSAAGYYACYVHKGSVALMLHEQPVLLQEGELLMFEWQEHADIVLEGNKDFKTDIIEVCITRR